MESNKLANMLSIISDNLSQRQIPFCLIGAMALGVYGPPRYTSDIENLPIPLRKDRITYETA